MSDLAATLDRAAAFLRGLPSDIDVEPNSLFQNDDGDLEMEGNGWRVWIMPVGDCWFEVWDPQHSVKAPFDGEQVPPAIVAAIRRVVGTEGE